MFINPHVNFYVHQQVYNSNRIAVMQCNVYTAYLTGVSGDAPTNCRPNEAPNGLYQQRRLITVKQCPGENDPQFPNQNLKYAIDFRTLPNLDRLPMEMMSSLELKS